MNDSPISVIYDGYGKELSIRDGYTTIAGQSLLVIGGIDGYSNAQAALTDTLGRVLTAHIDPTISQKWFSFAVSSTQTGSTVWTPGSGKRIVITSINLGSGGTTAGKLTLWFGSSGGGTTYTEGTNQPVCKLTFSPSATSTPGAILNYATPIMCANADYLLRLTTSAGLTIDGVIYGYEI